MVNGESLTIGPETSALDRRRPRHPRPDEWAELAVYRPTLTHADADKRFIVCSLRSQLLCSLAA
jgi:hypothetical protein